MKNMKCGEEANIVGSIDYWIVSCVSEDEIKELSKKCDLPISPTMCINYIDRNIQDPHIPGVVVFRGSRYIKNKGLGQDHINLLFSTILNGGQKRDCQNVKRGSFMNTDRRQTHMASGSMGEVSSSTDHQHCNVKEVEMSLKPFISGITGHAGAQATQQQDVSGQVGIGTVKQAFKKNSGMKVDHLESSGVCPYNLVTVPRPITFNKSKNRKRKRNEQYNESYNNTDHLDSNDCTDEDIGGMVRQYLEDSDSPKLVAYFDRQFKLFEDRLSNDKTKKSNKRYKYPLPTTCAWQLIETPEEYSFRHIQSFVVQGAGVSWDISSDVLADSKIVSGTFYGLLVRHLTSCSLYEEISSGGVTTIMPGMAANAAWGSSGGWKYLKTTGRERQQLVLSLLERHREEHNGALPRSLPQVDIRNYTVTSRSGRVLGLTLPSEAEVATVGRGATAVGRGRGRARSNASRRGAAARRRGRTR